MPFNPETHPKIAPSFAKAGSTPTEQTAARGDSKETLADFMPLRPLPETRLEAVLPYRPQMIPSSIRPWLEDVAERGQFHFDFLAVSIITVLGSAIGRGCAVYPKQRDDWHEYPNLWATIIGRPGAMKSPSLGATLAPLRRLENLWAEEYAKAIAEYKRALSRAQIESKAAKHLAQQAANKGKAFDLPDEVDLVEPVCQRVLTSDPTEAKLGELLAQNPRGLLLEMDELAALQAMFEREPSLREFFLKGWNGRESHTVDRIGRGTVRIPAICLSVVGGIQPGRIAPIVRDALRGAGGDGLLQRFQLIAWPDEWKSAWKNVDRWPDTAMKNAAYDVVSRLAHFKLSDSAERTTYGPPGLRFAPEAQEAFDSWHAKLHAEIRGAALSEVLEASLAKQAKLVAGIALIITLVEDPNAIQIPCQAVECALEWAAVSESHTRRLLNCHQAVELAAAHQILKKITSGKLTDGFAARDVKRAGWKGLTDPTIVDEALANLTECGWIRAEKVNVGSGGRPSCIFIGNPFAGMHFEKWGLASED